MALAHVQHANSSLWFSSSTTAAATFTTQNTAAANLYWLAVCWSNTAVTINGVADTEGNTWTPIGSIVTDVPNGFASQLFYAKNVVGGSKPTVTVTFSAATSNRDLAIAEVSGADTSSPLDGSAASLSAGSGTDGLVAATYTTTANGNYLAGATFSAAQSGQTLTAGTGYTLRVLDSGHSEMFGTESQIQSTASASTATTFTSSGFATSLVMGAAFKAASGVAPAVSRLPLLGVASLVCLPAWWRWRRFHALLKGRV